MVKLQLSHRPDDLTSPTTKDIMQQEALLVCLLLYATIDSSPTSSSQRARHKSNSRSRFLGPRLEESILVLSDAENYTCLATCSSTIGFKYIAAIANTIYFIRYIMHEVATVTETFPAMTGNSHGVCEHFLWCITQAAVGEMTLYYLFSVFRFRPRKPSVTVWSLHDIDLLACITLNLAWLGWLTLVGTKIAHTGLRRLTIATCAQIVVRSTRFQPFAIYHITMFSGSENSGTVRDLSGVDASMAMASLSPPNNGACFQVIASISKSITAMAIIHQPRLSAHDGSTSVEKRCQLEASANYYTPPVFHPNAVALPPDSPPTAYNIDAHELSGDRKASFIPGQLQIGAVDINNSECFALGEMMGEHGDEEKWGEQRKKSKEKEEPDKGSKRRISWDAGGGSNYQPTSQARGVHPTVMFTTYVEQHNTTNVTDAALVQLTFSIFTINVFLFINVDVVTNPVTLIINVFLLYRACFVFNLFPILCAVLATITPVTTPRQPQSDHPPPPTQPGGSSHRRRSPVRSSTPSRSKAITLTEPPKWPDSQRYSTTPYQSTTKTLTEPPQRPDSQGYPTTPCQSRVITVGEPPQRPDSQPYPTTAYQSGIKTLAEPPQRPDSQPYPTTPWQSSIITLLDPPQRPDSQGYPTTPYQSSICCA